MLSIDDLTGKPSGTAPGQFVSSGKEVAHALINKVIETAERRPPRSVGEVARPAEQHAVQLVAHLRPRLVIAGRQQASHFGLEPLHALLGGARA